MEAFGILVDLDPSCFDLCPDLTQLLQKRINSRVAYKNLNSAIFQYSSQKIAHSVLWWMAQDILQLLILFSVQTYADHMLQLFMWGQFFSSHKVIILISSKT